MVSLIIAGATGAIGRTVVQHALTQPRITKIIALTRSQNTSPDATPQLFGLTTARDAAELQKIAVTTFDWDDFLKFWRGFTATPTSAALQAPLARYKAIFSGHTYAAMCLGTTRGDAGSDDKFIECDYNYVIAFTEALLMFSAPAGFAPSRTRFAFNIDDKLKKTEPARPEAADATPPDAEVLARTSRTLQAICQMSSTGASASSWLLYLKTKGSADGATAERVAAHNASVKDPSGTVDGRSPLIKLSLLRPGALARGAKARPLEKVLNWFTGMPVDTCGRCIVAEFVRHDPAPARAAQLWLDESAAKPYPSRSAFEAKPEAIFVYHDGDIKQQAARLPQAEGEKQGNQSK